MQAKSLKKIDRHIQRLKDQLAALGPMRPGTLTRQYRHPREQKGAFWQISYTHQMKSRTEYARPKELAVLRKEIAAFRRFKKLTARWIELALQRSQIQIQQGRATANLKPKKGGHLRKTGKSSPQPVDIRPSK